MSECVPDLYYPSPEIPRGERIHAVETSVYRPHFNFGFRVMIYVFVASVLILSGMVFYKTIVTKEWRNVVPNEAAHWRGVIFYHNPGDPRYFLPKRTGLGWTINFAHPGAIVMVLLIMMAVVSFGKIMLDIQG